MRDPHPLFLILTTVVQSKFIVPIVELKTPEAQGGSDLPKVTQPVIVELGFQGWFCWHNPSACYTSFVSQTGMNCGAFLTFFHIPPVSKCRLSNLGTSFHLPEKSARFLLPQMLYRTVLLPGWLPSFLPPFSLSGEDQAGRSGLQSGLLGKPQVLVLSL